MFKFDALPDTNGFRIISVEYTEIRGFAGPDKHTHSAIIFDQVRNEWMRYGGDMKQIIPFLSQSRDVIYSAINKYQQPIVYPYIDPRYSDSFNESSMSWLNDIALAHIGEGWTKDWKKSIA